MRSRAWRRAQLVRADKRDERSLAAIEATRRVYPRRFRRQDREWLGRGRKYSKGNRGGWRWIEKRPVLAKAKAIEEDA